MALKPKPRIFLDSNVIFSGLHSPKGAPGIILEHFVKGRVSVVISQQVLEEVIRTVKDKLPEALPALRRLLISLPPEVVADPEADGINRLGGRLSIGDTAVLGAAMAAKPDYFITGDKHFLGKALAEDTGLSIMTPAQFLKTAQLEED